MTRVSLKEAYDNKDVVAQIYAIRDTAESAEDTAEQAVTTANTASEHVDALVPQVEGAVQNANSASASAQASAQTVAGYENRLATAENDIDGLESDFGAVTLRVQTAEGQIVTIQGQITSITSRLGTAEGKISALETADAQNVKINRIDEYAVGLTGNQRAISGGKNYAFSVNNFAEIDAFTTSRAGWHKVYTIRSSQRWMGVLNIFKNSNDYLLARACMYEYLIVINTTTTAGIYYVTRLGSEPGVVLTYDGTVWNVWINTPSYQRTFMQLDSKAYAWSEYDAEFKVDNDYMTVREAPVAEDFAVYKTPVVPS